MQLIIGELSLFYGCCTWDFVFDKKSIVYVLSSKIIMVQSYVLFSQAKYPKKGILLDET
jgi:hypothetical protein